LLRLLVERGLLLALPFAAWFAWREVAHRTGRPMGSTPWAWLFAAGMVLVGVSLMATAVFHADNRAETYIPATTGPDGRVSPGHFEKRAPSPP